MVFDCAHLVWYCSQFMVLEPGDVIITGTPPGVALGMKPTPKYLKPGDVVRLGVAGLGEQTQKVVRFRVAGLATDLRLPQRTADPPPHGLREAAQVFLAAADPAHGLGLYVACRRWHMDYACSSIRSS